MSLTAIPNNRTCWILQGTNGSYIGIASAEVCALSHNVIFKLDGMDIETYMRNPIMYHAHEYGTYPVGKIVETTIADAFGAKALLVHFQLDAKEEELIRKIDEGYIRGLSIGVQPLEYGETDV